MRFSVAAAITAFAALATATDDYYLPPKPSEPKPSKEPGHPSPSPQPPKPSHSGGGGEGGGEVVTKFVTYCPAPTTITYGSQTHVVTEPGYVTITDVIVSTPMITETLTECNDCPTNPPGGVHPTGGPQPSKSVPPHPSGGQPTQSNPPEYTGAASRAMAGAGAGLAGVLGVAAFVL